MRSTNSNLIDYEKRRRQYLAEVAGLHAKSWAYLLGAIILGFATFISALATIAMIFMIGYGWEYVAALVCWLMITTALFAGARSAIRTANRADDLARSLPRVPPVCEQVAALPLKETLVRGSAEQTAPVEQLLRSALQPANEGDIQLLRPVETNSL